MSTSARVRQVQLRSYSPAKTHGNVHPRSPVNYACSGAYRVKIDNLEVLINLKVTVNEQRKRPASASQRSNQTFDYRKDSAQLEHRG